MGARVDKKDGRTDKWTEYIFQFMMLFAVN